MAIETALRVSLPNRPGELARVARQLANAGVNVRSVAGVSGAGEGVLEFLVDNLDAASAALRQGGTSFQETRVATSPIPGEVVSQPGALAHMAEALAREGINIESLYAAVGEGGQIMAVLGCSDPERAEPVLKTWGA